jgi:cytochrome c553
MKRIAFLFFSLVILVSCQNKTEGAKNEEIEACTNESTATEEGFEMYKMSEMAALMEQMYVDNQRLKDRILKGDTIGQFPQHFTRIHEAVLTDETDKDEFFNIQAKKFIEAQELIYKDPENAKQHFNNGVDACIKCHEVKCGGPIPKIKKLYIK